MKTRRYKKGGILGLGGKAMVEVYAGVERDLSTNGKDPDRVSSGNGSRIEQLIASGTNGNNQPSQALPPGAGYQTTIYQPGYQNGGTQQATAATVSTSRLESEVQRLGKEIAEIRRAIEEGLGSRKESEEKEEGSKYPRWLGHLREKLIANEINYKTADAMIEETLRISDAGMLADFEGTLAAFQKTVSSSIEARGSLAGIQTPRVLALAGPTGVGKTTTLAKLAATANLLDKQRVGLISADTYRIAAIDQLKTFAGILDIPVKVVFSPAELREALKDYAGMDRVFIDTAGRSPNNDERIEELRELMEAHEDVACHLVVSATTRPKDMSLICERFRPSKFSRSIFTKIDETDTLGPVLALMYSEGLPASYLTNGQSVPDDIVLGEESDLVSLIVRRSLS